MVAIRVRDTEGCEPQPNLLWDTVWIQRLDATGGFGDWMLAGQGDQRESLGGLRAEAGLHTATLLCLFTDARAPEDEVLPGNDGDRRGWWGDSVLLDDEPEKPLGSLLWLLERAVLDEHTRYRAQVYAEEALAVLVEQGAVARTVVTTDVRQGQGFLGIFVEHFAHDGAAIYQQRFNVLWQQAGRNAPMNFGDQGVFV